MQTRGREVVWFSGALLVLGVGCGGDSGSGDAMPPGVDSGRDGGGADSGPAMDGGGDASLDVGVLDAGVLDVGVLDAGVLDAGVLDAGVDTGAPPEAGPASDAGDAGGTMDAGPSVDAGAATDAGSAADAAVPVCSASSNLRLTPDPTSSNAGGLVWDGTGYGVAWSANGDIFFQRLDASGMPLGAPTPMSTDPASSEGISLAWSGTEYAVTWYDQRDGNYEIYFARADAAGAKIGNDVRVTNDAGRSWGAVLAWNGAGYGVAWWENRGAEGDEVYFARLDEAGAKVGGDVRVTTAGQLSGSPSLVSNGTGYGVAWSDRRDGNSEIYFALLDADGAKIGADMRVTNASGSSGLPSLVWNGTGYGLGWEDNRDGRQELFFTRLDGAGQKIGGDLFVSDRLFTPWNLVWNGTGYAAAWSDARTGDPENLEVYFVELDSAGTRLDVDLRVTNAASQSRAPALVWTGAHYGVVWTDARDGVWALYFSELCL